MVQSNKQKAKFDNELRQIVEELEEGGEIFTELLLGMSPKLQYVNNPRKMRHLRALSKSFRNETCYGVACTV